MNRRGWNEASTRAARKVNGLRESAGNRASVAGSAVHLFDAEPMMHPNVLDAYKQAARVLKKKRIQFRETGGIALNLRGAGRPTKDIDLVVRRSDWLRAIQAVSEIATDRPGIRFGLPQKPEAGLAVIGPHCSQAGLSASLGEASFLTRKIQAPAGRRRHSTLGGSGRP